MHRFLILSFLIFGVVLCSTTCGLSLGFWVGDLGSDRAFDEAGNMYVVGCIGTLDINDHADFVKKYDNEGKTAWMSRYGWAKDSYGSCTAIAVDTHGNAYVTGLIGKMKDGQGVEGSAVTTTVKYDTNGKRLWAVPQNVPERDTFMAEGIAVDKDGNVCITGVYTKDNPDLILDANQWDVYAGYNSDFLTIKYDGNGRRLWEARYRGSKSFENLPWSIAVDEAGNVYVVGGCIVDKGMTGTESYLLTIKHAGDGRQLWIARYTVEPNNIGSADRLTVDKAGSVYVVGETLGDEGSDLVTIKYDKNGKKQWVARHRIQGRKSVFPQAIALAQDGSVCVTGYISSRTSGSGYPASDLLDVMKKHEIVTVKYDANGKERWSAKYKGPEGSIIYSENLLVDDKDNIYIIGYMNVNILIIKYSPDGDEKWTRQFKTASELVRFLATVRKLP